MGIERRYLGGHTGFKKGHGTFAGSEKGWFRKGSIVGIKTRFKKGMPRVCTLPRIKNKHIISFPKGPNHANWKRGIKTSGDGHILVYRPDHHFPDYWGYVRRARIVVEEHWSLCLLPWANVHHKDHNKWNDIWYNLYPMMCSAHTRLHSMEAVQSRQCIDCGSKHEKKWYKAPNGRHRCRRCHNKRNRECIPNYILA